MKRRLAMAVGISVLLIAALLPSGAAASTPRRFGRVDTSGKTLDVARVLSLIDKSKPANQIINVVVQLAGDPVAVHVGAALDAGGTFSDAQKADVRRLLAVRQAAVSARLRSLGASIESTFTDVLNGFHVQVAANKVGAIARLPGVAHVYSVPRHFTDNLNTVSYLGADTTWGQTGFTGAGVTIASIDSGINYDHLDFNGAGAVAYANNNGTIIEPGTFPTAKVVGGFDLVGDAYDPGNGVGPTPDPDPLDCKDVASPNVQHGTHTSATAAGVGVTADGHAYGGPYNASTLSSTNFRIGPGVAPRAKLMSFRVFGCQGGTDFVVDAIEMAVRAGANVINMSLGSPEGNPGSIDSIASNNAALAGVTVVASSGNDGTSAFVTGSPGVATRVISVAAVDAQPGFPGATIDMTTGADISAINANGNTNGLPITGNLNVFHDDPSTACDGTSGAGCEESGTRHDSYVFNNYVAGQIPVTFRGNGARVDRAIQGTTEGAPAVIMVSNAEAFPPFENVIPGATIPFLGVPLSAGARFVADDGNSATLSAAGTIVNPTFQHTAPFTSAGPRRLDLMIKPDVTAPGVSVFSADGGNASAADGKNLSGTSMAAPATAGVAALVKQAHPTWTPRDIKAAIVGTASPNKVVPYDVRIAGAGLATPRRAVDTRSFVYTDPGSSSLTFGYHQLAAGAGTVAYRQTRKLTIRNTGATSIRYRLSNAFNGPRMGLGVKITPTAVNVPAHSKVSVNVTLRMSETAAAALPDVSPNHAPNILADDFGTPFAPVLEVDGAITATPTTSGAGIYSLRVPWLVAPRGLSAVKDVTASRTAYKRVGDVRRASIKVKNFGLHTGIADVYQWGLLDGNDTLAGIDLRVAGVQSVDPAVCDPATPADARCLIFAINTYGKWNNPGENIFEADLDIDGDGTADVAVLGIDASLIFGPDTLTGDELSVIVDLATGNINNLYFASAPTDGSTLLLPAATSDIGLSATGPQAFGYTVSSQTFFDDSLQVDDFGGRVARFNAFANILSNGQFVSLAPGQSFKLPLRVNITRFNPTLGELGWLIVTHEDANGQFQADTVPVGRVPR